MMKINYNSNTIVFYSENSGKFISIHRNYRIQAFCINEKYIAVLEDWEYLSINMNLHIYSLEGEFLFSIPKAPKALYDDGFYSSIGFEGDSVLIAQSSDYRYKIDLSINKFIDEKYTK